MLRRKMLAIIFCQTALLMALAVVALWSLHGVFQQMGRLSQQSQTIVQQANTLNGAISTIQVELYALQSSHTQQLDTILDAFAQMRTTVEQLGRQPVLKGPLIEPTYDLLTDQLSEFEQHIAMLATWQNPSEARAENLKSLHRAAEIRETTVQLTHFAHDRIEQDQAGLTERFRRMVISLAIGFLLVVNASILLLIRASAMILRPMEQLVQASHELAQENFDCRLSLGRHDEFDELAEAYNHLAEQLGENEERKLEVLNQVGLTLNHELNNAVAIIELQLNLLKRRSGNQAAFDTSLKQCHDGLHRMAHVIDALKHIRRIVLTDYVEGVKMLDLERSIQEDGAPAEILISPEGALTHERTG